MSKIRFVALTTSDNPFDPFNQFESWNNFDKQKKYFTNELLARRVRIPDNIPLSDQTFIKEKAIDSIIKNVPVFSNDPKIHYEKFVLEEDEKTFEKLSDFDEDAKDMTY